MFHKDRPKDPKKVAAGQAAHRKLTAHMSASEYRDFQRHCRQRALDRYPTMQQRGASEANRAQLREWDGDEYIEQRKAAYLRCIERHGERIAKGAIRRATLQRRLSRLHQPTPGEAALRALLQELGFTIHLDVEPFDFCLWRLDPFDRPLGPYDALAESGVGPYFCDLLLPVLALAIEVEGGVHVLNRARDARRHMFFEAQGLMVLVVPDTDEQPLDLARVAQLLAPYLPISLSGQAYHAT
jgi:Protein of unknown function (DUF559)